MSDLLRMHKTIYGGKASKTASFEALPSMVIPPKPLVSREGLITLLNEDLVLEYTAALQYLQHYARLQGPEFSFFKEELKKHAMEELGHAAIISDRVTFLGGVPAVGTGSFKISPSSREMLNQDLADEAIAVNRYKERVVQALSLGEYGLANALQGILADEEEHFNDIQTVLSKDAGD